MKNTSGRILTENEENGSKNVDGAVHMLRYVFWLVNFFIDLQKLTLSSKKRVTMPKKFTQPPEKENYEKQIKFYSNMNYIGINE